MHVALLCLYRKKWSQMFDWVVHSVRFAIEKEENDKSSKLLQNFHTPPDVFKGMVSTSVHLPGHFECRTSGPSYLPIRWQKQTHLDGMIHWWTIKYKTRNIISVHVSWLIELMANLFTSAECPKNVCIWFNSRTSHNLHVRSTDPVTNWLPSGDNEIETTSPPVYWRETGISKN